MDFGDVVISESLKGVSFTDGSFDENGDFYFAQQLKIQIINWLKLN